MEKQMRKIEPVEIWNLYLEDGTMTEEVLVRGQKIPKDRFHLCVHVWIRNAQGQFLMAQRAADRKSNPNQWECPGGHVVAGESSLQGALREVKEEIGVDLDPASGQLVFSKIRETINGKVFQDLLDVWLFDYQGQPHLNLATCQESQACRWMTVDQIQELYDEGKFVKNLDYFFMIDLKNFEAWKANLIKQDQAILQTVVHGKIDRPLGSAHPKYPDLVYPINYGYVPEVVGGDGQEQDVYFLGPDRAQADFSGVVIGVWHRLNDVETKWIVAAPEQQFSAAQILGQIAFQEQYFYGLLILAGDLDNRQ